METMDSATIMTSWEEEECTNLSEQKEFQWKIRKKRENSYLIKENEECNEKFDFFSF